MERAVTFLDVAIASFLFGAVIAIIVRHEARQAFEDDRQVRRTRMRLLKWGRRP